MILTSHQPNFLPYMGFFYKAYRSDVLVISDDVQFSKKGMHNWNYIFTKDGPKKLTLPVKAHHDTALKDVMVDQIDYSIGKIAKTLRQEYCHASHKEDGERVISLMEDIASSMRKMPSMAGFNMCLNAAIMGMFGIRPEFHIASQMGIHGHKDERIFQMCEELGADVYLSGTGAKAYHDEEEYARRGIELVYSDYKPLRYPQYNGYFVENLSVIDYVFNNGLTIPEEWRNAE